MARWARLALLCAATLSEELFTSPLDPLVRPSASNPAPLHGPLALLAPNASAPPLSFPAALAAPGAPHGARPVVGGVARLRRALAEARADPARRVLVVLVLGGSEVLLTITTY